MNASWIRPVALFAGIGLVTLLASGKASAFKLAPAITGARVTAVAAGSPAQRLGLEAGDVIVGINNQPVRTVDDLPGLIGGSSRVTLLIRDVRTGKYNQSDVSPSHGRLGIRFVMTTVPEVVIPPLTNTRKP